MSSQIFASPSFGKMLERAGAAPTPVPPGLATSAPRHRRVELRFHAGILVYLLCVAGMGISISGVLFGIGLYLLAHPTKEIIVANSAAPDRGGATVVPDSVSMRPTGEAPAMSLTP